MKRIICVLILAISFLSGSCKKDEPVTKTSLLTAGPWRRTATMADPGIEDNSGNVVTNLYAQYPACFKDNRIRFETPDILIFDEGASKCNPNDLQLSNNTWSFNADETIVIANLQGTKTNFTLVELNEKSLKYSYIVGTNRGGSIVTETFIRD